MSTVKCRKVDIMANSKMNIRKTTIAMTQTAVCAALLCVLSPLAIPTPISISITLQVLVVVLTALILKPVQALAAQVIYTLLGGFGLPVFSNYTSGFGVIVGPTGGFIVGFIVASFLVSLLKGKADGKLAVVRYILVSVFVAIPVIYLFGIIFMCANGKEFGAALKVVFSTFILIDVAKCVIASLFAVPINLALKKL